MPPNDSVGGAIWQDGEQSLRLLPVNHRCLSEVPQPHGGDVHECDRHSLPQLRDAICYHSQRDDGQSLALGKCHLRHKTSYFHANEQKALLFILVGTLCQTGHQRRQTRVYTPRLKLDICLSGCHWQPSGQ